MAALGIGVVFMGYTIALHGYCLFKGYNVTYRQLWSPIWPPPGVKKTTPDDSDTSDGARRGGSGTF